MRESDRHFSGDDLSIRPKDISEYIGQDDIRSNLKVYIKAALQRDQALDHTLFYGPPGLGKTTLAHIISSELKVPIRVSSGPMLTKGGDLVAILTNLREREILFIDEIHRLSSSVEEILYSAMEDYRIDIIIGQGAAAKTINFNLSSFTLVGATTRAGLLTSPLRDRFGIIQRLDFYSVEDLALIIDRSARILGFSIDEDGKNEIAKRSRGTPRIAIRLLKRVRDFAQVSGSDTITEKIAEDALYRLDVDKRGLDKIDRQLLKLIAEQFNGGPVGIDTLSAALSEEKDTIEELIEPYLLQEGFIQRTPRGRVIMESGYKHIRIDKRDSDCNDNAALPF